MVDMSPLYRVVLHCKKLTTDNQFMRPWLIGGTVLTQLNTRCALLGKEAVHYVRGKFMLASCCI